MMTSIEWLYGELGSTDLVRRRNAARFAWESGSEGIILVPYLLELISDDSYSEPHAFNSLGMILHAFDKESPGNKRISESNFGLAMSTLESLLGRLNGARLSMLIYTISLVCRRSETVNSAILTALERDNDRRLHLRAYQYACTVEPQLLESQPWKSFIPKEPELLKGFGSLY